MTKKKILIVAHPDDELIFFSSILQTVDKIVVCFGKSFEDNNITNGRKILQKSYPLKNVEWLNLDESDTYLSSNWNKPFPTVEGLKVNRNKFRYQNLYYELCDIFKSKLEPYDIIYTHNPWGEYGHEEHISVFNSVQKSINGNNKKLFVSCYASDRSEKLYLQKKHFLNGEIQKETVPKKLCLEIKNLYVRCNCWTWDDNYEWPNSEIFAEIGGASIKNIVRDNNLKVNPPIMIFSKSFKINILNSIISKIIPNKLKYILKSIIQKKQN